MSSKRFKFHGSTISVLTGFSDDSPSHAITGITQANPAVVTSSSHGLSTGDIIQIAGVQGMTEVNGEIYAVVVVDANTFQLHGVNSEGYGAYVSAGGFDEGELSNFCELTDYNRTGAAAAELDATSLCSTAKEFEVDLPDFGTTELGFNFAPRTAIQEALQESYNSGDKTAVVVQLPNSGGHMVQLGFVQNTSETSGRGALWSGTATIRNTGARLDVAA